MFSNKFSNSNIYLPWVPLLGFRGVKKTLSCPARHNHAALSHRGGNGGSGSLEGCSLQIAAVFGFGGNFSRGPFHGLRCPHFSIKLSYPSQLSLNLLDFILSWCERVGYGERSLMQRRLPFLLLLLFFFLNGGLLLLLLLFSLV